MVLPPSPPDDAPRAAEARWLDSLKFALRLSRSGLLLLVDHARQESLGELVEALVPEHPDLDVHTDVQRMLEVPHGATVVLVPRPEDADWLNINRPLFAQRELRVVLFCDTETSIALARRAVDFFDWISHRVECPIRPPRFAVAGIRTVLAVQAPGILWTGGDLQAAFAAARPHGRLHHVSAAIPYSKMVEAIREHRRDWIAWTDVNSHFRLRRVRWAHAETGHRTRAILLEPTVPSPGWWTVHGRMTDAWTARAQLENAEVPFPGRVAATHDFEPGALARIASHTEGPGEERATKRKSYDLLQGNAPPVVSSPAGLRRLRDSCIRGHRTLGERLVKDNTPTFDDVLIYAAWSATFERSTRVTEIPVRAIAKLSARLGSTGALELMLPRWNVANNKWAALAVLSITGHDLEAAEHWVQKSKAAGEHATDFIRALLHSMKGEPAKSEALLAAQLHSSARSLNTAPLGHLGLVSLLVSALNSQGKYHEAEALIREELARFDHALAPELASRLFSELSSTLRLQGRLSAAAETIRRELGRFSDTSNEARVYRGSNLVELALILAEMEENEEAEKVYREALAHLGDTLGVGHDSYATTLLTFHNLLARSGKQGELESQLRQTILTSQDHQAAESPILASLMSCMADILIDQGHYDEAEGLLHQVLRINSIFHPDEPAENCSVLDTLARVLERQGRYDEAERIFRQSLSITQPVTAPHIQKHRVSLLGLGRVLLQRHRPEEAEPLLARAFELHRLSQEPDDDVTIDELLDLALTQETTGNPSARDTARLALDILARTPELVPSIEPGVIGKFEDIAKSS